MFFAPKIRYNPILIILIFLIALYQSCVTIQLKDAAERPRIIGFGSLKAINIPEAKLFSTTFPGIGL